MFFLDLPAIQELTDRITKLEAHCFSGAGQQSQVTVAKEQVAREQAEDDDDDDVDLFGSDVSTRSTSVCSSGFLKH